MTEGPKRARSPSWKFSMESQMDEMPEILETILLNLISALKFGNRPPKAAPAIFNSGA
jgi:hypothetical protein